MGYEIIRMPASDDGVKRFLEEFGAFFVSMYSEDEEKIHGEWNFGMDNFLFLWDNGGVFVLAKRDDAGTILGLTICTQYRDLWSGRARAEIQRMVVREGVDPDVERESIIRYLKGVASLMKFDQIYFLTHYVDGNVLKELVWNNRS